MSNLRRLPPILLVGALFLVLSCAPAAQQAERPRNVVVVCLDTVRHDVFGLPETSGLGDSLSGALGDALIFDRTQTTAPWTVPAVASALTGLYPNRHGAGHFEDEVADLSHTVPSAIRPETRTLAERLSAAGFDTAAFVAHPWFRTGYALDRGFDSLELRAHSQSLLDLSLSWLDRFKPNPEATQPQQPFFLYLHFMEAHEAHRKPSGEIDQVFASLPEALRLAGSQLTVESACARPASEKCRRFVAYVAGVLDLRARIASLLDGLADRQLLDETLVVVYSDHGEEFDEHVDEQRAAAWDPRSIFGAGHGHSLYQELLRVPLLVWHPGYDGQRHEVPVALIDIVPSILDWLGIPKDSEDELQGLTLASLLTAPPASRPLFASSIAYGPRQVAVLDGVMKRVHVPGRRVAQLFDLAADPSEKRPVEDRQAAFPLDRLIGDHLSESVGPADSAVPDIGPELLEQLQALGYLDAAGDGEPR